MKKSTRFKFKADFNQTYRDESPVGYFRKMEEVNYLLPSRTKPYYLGLISYIVNMRKKADVRVADVGCSYGVNAALINGQLEMEDLFRIYNSAQGIPETEDQATSFYGIDTSAEAIRFSTRAGLHKDGFCENIENESMSSKLSALLSSIDLVISTGCVGYFGRAGFENLLRHSGAQAGAGKRSPLFCFSCLRYLETTEYGQAFAGSGYKMTKVNPQPVVQRDFINATERAETVRRLKARGLATGDYEEKGKLTCDVYVAAPAAELRPAVEHLEINAV